MADNIVEGWLRSVNLVHYTQSFLDNGYDDLEVCKQIGEADLDAIGVVKKEHREKLLRAVRILKEEGGTAVYFTLEDAPENGYEDNNPLFAELGPAPSSPPITYTEAYDVGKSTLLTFPKIQLKHILQNKLYQDEIDLSSPPYTTSDFSLCQSSLTALAVKYATELKTHFADVWDRLEELWRIAREYDTFTSLCRSPMHSIYGGSNHYGFSPRGCPPPLPTCLPPNTSHVDRYQSLEHQFQGVPSRHDNYALQDYAPVDGDVKGHTENSGKKSSGLGKFLRNLGIRKSGRKNTYKQTSAYDLAGDLLASDITMCADDRIALMVMVKEGKISTETALEVVRRFEEEKKIESGKENNQKGKKKKGGKPTKSQSAVYTDETPKCHVCQHLMQNEDYEEPLPPVRYDGNTPLYECCRHRRVHSVGHIDFSSQPHSPQFVRAFSCSPTRNPTATNTQTGQSPALSSRGLYSPILAQTPKYLISQHQSQGVEALRERFIGKPQMFINKTQSRTSLLSSESDQSMECTSHVPLKAEVATTRNDDMNYCSNSTVSMSSENSPASGRKKQNDAAKVKGQRWHRSASYSTGDDGISSENDDHDDARLLGAQNSGKLGGKLKDMKKKVMKNKVDGSAHEDSETRARNAAAHNLKPALFRENSFGLAASAGGHTLSTTPDSLVYTGPFVGKARVHSDYLPKDNDEFMALKKGEIVNIINMDQSGVWRGSVNGKAGIFKFCHVEIITDDVPVGQRKDKQSRRKTSRKSKPTSVEELMQRIGLEHLTSLFLLNGYELLDTFSEIDEEDLNVLNISDPAQRAKLLTAAELLLDGDSTEASDGHVKSERSGSAATSSDTASSLSPATVPQADTQPPRTGNSSRDSGCYASSEQLLLREAQKVQAPLHAKIVPTNSVLRGDNSRSPSRDNCVCKMCGKVRIGGSKSKDNLDEGMDTDKSDREYTEEDKEVCAITYGYETKKVSPPDKSVKNVPKVTSSYCKSCSHKKRDVQSTFSSKQTASPSNITPSAQVQPDTHSSVAACSATSNHNSIYGTRSKQKVKPVPPPRIPALENPSPQLQQAMDEKRQAMMQNSVHNSSIYGRTKPPLTNTPITNPYMPTSFSFQGKIMCAHDKAMSAKSAHTEQNEPIYGQKTIRNVSRSLIPLVSTKLSAEKIDLSEEPYSTYAGGCGIPPLLVQRYAEELRQDINSVAPVLEQVRLYCLQNQKRTGIPNEHLADSCSNACDLKILCIEDFMCSIGLPMYIEGLYQRGCCTVELLLTASEADIFRMTGADARHIKRISHAIEWVRLKLSSPVRSPMSPKSPKSPRSAKPTTVSYTDKV